MFNIEIIIPVKWLIYKNHTLKKLTIATTMAYKKTLCIEFKEYFKELKYTIAVTIYNEEINNLVEKITLVRVRTGNLILS